MSYLRFKNIEVDVDLELKDKYIFISGFSGEGKSKLFSDLDEALQLEPESVQSDLPIICVKTQNELNQLESIVDNRKCIVVADEILAYKIIQKTISWDVYCVLITRKVYSQFNFSYRCLYKAVRGVDGVTRLQSRFGIKGKMDCEGIDIVITEDSKAGYEFIREAVSKDIEVISAKGKSNIERIAKECLKSAKGVCIVADGGGLGSVVKRLIGLNRLARNKAVKLGFILPECFEEILLCSKFLNKPLDIFEYFDLRYDNTERFCEEVLTDLTKGKPFEYDHANQELTKCWIINCEDCDNAKNCDSTINGDKIEAVLQNSNAKALLDLR